MVNKKLPLCAVFALCFIIASCGSDESNPAGIASLATQQDASDEGIAEDSLADSDDVDSEQAALDFSQCMRDEGLEFPDLAVDANGSLNLRSVASDVDPGSEEFQSAMDSCRSLLDGASFGGGVRAAIAGNVEIQDALVEFSQCVRVEGYDVGDLTIGPAPGAGSGAGSANSQGQSGQGARQGGFGDRSARIAERLGIDPDDPDVVETIDGCLPILEEAFAAAGFGQ